MKQRTKQYVFALKLFLLLSLLKVVAAEILTDWKPSAWGIDFDGLVTQEPRIWSTTSGYWVLDSSNYLVQNTNDIPGWDFLWEVDNEGNLVLK